MPLYYTQPNVPDITTSGQDLSNLTQFEQQPQNNWDKFTNFFQRPNFDYKSALASGASPQDINTYDAMRRMNPTGMQTVSGLVNVGSQLAGLYMGFANYNRKADLFDKQMDMMNYKFGQMKDEVNRVKKVRSKLAKIY